MARLATTTTSRFRRSSTPFPSPSRSLRSPNPRSPDNTKKPAKKAKGGVPKTGDATMPAAVAGLLVAGVAAGAAGAAARRRNR